MAPSCSLEPGERYARMSVGAGFVLGGFLLHQDALAESRAIYQLYFTKKRSRAASTRG